MTRTLIIAEAGVNHNGDINKAKLLIEAAGNAGADFVKFQSFKASKMTSAAAKMATYQKKNLNTNSDDQLDMLKKLELSLSDLNELRLHADACGVQFLSTAFDLDSFEILQDMGMPLWKVASGELTNKPLIEAYSSTGKPIVLSTGMADMEEIRMVVSFLRSKGYTNQNLTILHCTTDYPTAMSDVNLRAMNTLEKEFSVSVGYSDHTLGIEVPIAAVARGAVVIEKHFTLSRELPGPDHKASLEPDELKSMVQAIRNIEAALGSSEKKPSATEMENRNIARKSIHFSRSLSKGDAISMKDLIMLRPGAGISAWKYEEFIGRTLCRDVEEGKLLEISDVE